MKRGIPCESDVIAVVFGLAWACVLFAIGLCACGVQHAASVVRQWATRQLEMGEERGSGSDYD